MKPNQADIEASFRSHHPKVLGYCVRMVGNRQTAEELVQDVFVAACSSAKDSEITKAWLFRCARNRCIDHLRRRGIWGRIKCLLTRDSIHEGVDEQVIERSVGLNILRKLPEKMRTALVLRSYAGLDYRELAEILEIQEASVKVLLSRARKRACEMWSEEQSSE